MQTSARQNRRGVSRLAKLLAAACVLTLLLTAASLAVNHIELSVSMRGDPWNAGEGSVESTHLQLGFRDAWFYASRQEWIRTEEFGLAGRGNNWPTAFPAIVRISEADNYLFRGPKIELNGFALAALLGLYPLIAFLRHAWRSRRKPENACLTCHYDLTGNTSGVCPECGSPADTNSPGKSPSATPPITAAHD